MSIFATLFLEGWKRYHAEVAWKWGLLDFEVDEVFTFFFLKTIIIYFWLKVHLYIIILKRKTTPIRLFNADFKFL